MPGIVEADDDGTWVAKFTAAGQGPGALVAEVVVAHLAHAVGLRVPVLKVFHLERRIGAAEGDPEIRHLLVESVGEVLGMDWLPGSVTLDPNGFRVSDEVAATVRWLDALVGNIDRTWRNPNMLVWHDQLWLIDHGAALPWQHAWARRDDFDDESRVRAAAWRVDLSDHVLVGLGNVVDFDLADRITDEVIVAAVDRVPDDWLQATASGADVAAIRQSHVDVLTTRLADPSAWLDGADHPELDMDDRKVIRTRRDVPDFLR